MSEIIYDASVRIGIHEGTTQFLRDLANGRVTFNHVTNEYLSGRLLIYVDALDSFRKVPKHRADCITLGRIHEALANEWMRLQEEDNTSYPYEEEDLFKALRSMGARAVEGRQPRLLIVTPEREKFDADRSLILKAMDEKTANDARAYIGLDLVEAYMPSLRRRPLTMN